MTVAYRCIIQEPNWGMNADGSVDYSRRDQDEKLALVFERGYEARGYVVHAVDKRAEPKQIGDTATSFFYTLQLERESDGTVVGHAIGRTEINAKLSSRAQMMDYLGAAQWNPVRAWCAVNHEERVVYFSIWGHTIKRDRPPGAASVRL